MRNKLLSIITMLATMIADQVVRQLMTQRDPPIDDRLCSSSLVSFLQAPQVQLCEEAVVAEDGAASVEGDGAAGWVVVDM